MTTPAAWDFSGVGVLHEALRPRTPWGKRAKETRRFITDASDLARQYDLTDAALALGERRAAEMDRIDYHLRRVSDVDGLGDPAAMDAADLFVVKKFLVNCRAVIGLLDAEARAAFDLRFAFDDLLAHLDVDESGLEGFSVSNGCRPELRDLRRRLRVADEERRRLRDRMHRELIDEWGLDFRVREFLVVARERASSFPRDRLVVEPYDDAQVIVRPAAGDALLEQHAVRDRLARREREVEREVVADLAVGVAARMDDLHGLAAAIGQFDLSLARAKLCAEFRLVRPSLREPRRPIEIRGARLPGLEARCRGAGMRYWPLDLRLEEPHGIIHGSNMCGKTVALRTVACCQLAAQLGMFAPAERFETGVFDEVSYVGPLPVEAEEGLSGFGAEIVQMSRALAADGGARLVFVDEFARNTGSDEAVALISGLLEWLGEQSEVRMVMATHHRPLPRLRGIAWFRMKGLLRERFAAACSEPGADDAGTALTERLKSIQQCIEYRVVPDDDGEHPRDALHVAAALGLDGRIVALARRYATTGDPEAVSP